MPRKNIVKQYVRNSFYHIYSRGVNKEFIFREPSDYVYFLGLMKRYLSSEKSKNGARVNYPQFNGLKLVAYCLMTNHFHILVYQEDDRTIAYFMKSLMTSYSMYFNKKYRRVGPVFQSSYKAGLVDTEAYLDHISRYIHLNPPKWRSYEYSSLPYFLGNKSAQWISPQPILELFDNDARKYLLFVKDYEGQKIMLDELKWELANKDD